MQQGPDGETPVKTCAAWIPLFRHHELAGFDLDDHHGIGAQTVVIRGAQVIGPGYPHVPPGIFNGRPQGLGVGAVFPHGVGHDGDGIPGIARMSVDGELLIIMRVIMK